MTRPPFNHEQWWAAEEAARLREGERGRDAMADEYVRLRKEVEEVLEGYSMPTRVTVLAHLLVEAGTLAKIGPGNILEVHDLKDILQMLKHSIDFMGREIIPQKMMREYKVRLTVQVGKTGQGKNPS